MQASPLITKLMSSSKLTQTAIQETAGQTINYSELHRRSDEMAYYLLEKGLKRGDRVLLLMKPGIDAVISVLATLKAGGTLVIADPGTGNELFKQRIAEALPSWTCIDPTLNRLRKNRLLLKLARRLAPDIPDLGGVVLPQPIAGPRYSTIGPSGLPKLQADDEALIVFTSGTTSKPKGVVHTHKTLALSLASIEKLLTVERPRLYTTQPYFLLLGIGLGAEVIINSASFSPAHFMADSTRYQPNVTFGPPGEFIPLISYCIERGILFPGSYQQVLFGSAPITKPFLEKFYAIASPDIETLCLYGMTEALPIATISGRAKLACRGEGDPLGSPVSGISVKIGTDHQLAVSGEQVMRHYLNQEPQEWIQTGDLVRVDTSGCLVLQGRKKDMILRRSYNIYPSLYEPTIARIPGVRDVALIGVYDELLADERVILVLEPETGQQLTVATVQKQLTHGAYSIDSNALPDEIVIMDIPYIGRQRKIDKQALRKVLAL